MQQRKLGNTALNLSVIGMGTWAIGGSGWKYSWGPQDDKESIEAIHAALDSGINWIDTAAIYGLGHSEKVIAKALKGKRHKVILATKCGLIWNKQWKISGSLKKESIRKEIEASLKRLKTEVIDLYQIHWPMPPEDIHEAWIEINKLITAGKIRYAGVSNFNTEQLKSIQEIHPIASLQPPYSMLKQDIETKILAYAKINQIGIVVYSPMQKGILTGKFTKERLINLPRDDHRRHKDPNFHEPQFSLNLKLVEKLQIIANKYQKTIGQLAIAWCLRKDEITSAIVGARNKQQIQENAAAYFKIEKEDLIEIENLLFLRDQELKKLQQP